MVQQPLKKAVEIGTARSNFQEDAGQIILRVVKINSVYGQKDQHDMCADALIPVNERMILD